MTDALYLADPEAVAAAGIGDLLSLEGDEGRHAATVKRTRVGERIILSGRQGRGVRVEVTEVASGVVTGRVVELLGTAQPRHTWRVVQGLAKGERGELSVELLTEVGVDEVAAWQSRRSIVKWDAKADKALAKWRSTAREAAKQSRRLSVPHVHPSVLTPRTVLDYLRSIGGVVLVAHEEAEQSIASVELPSEGPVTVLVGPEGGISPEEITELRELGAVPVLISDGVLRASTAGAVALVQLKLLAEQAVGR